MDLHRVVLDVRIGEALKLSDGVSIELVRKSGQLARLCITAPLDVVISKSTTEGMEFRNKHALVEPS